MAHLSMFVSIVTLALAGYVCGDDIEMPPECAGKTYCTVQPDYYIDRVGNLDGYIKTNKYWAGLSAQKDLEDLTPTIVHDDNNCGYETKIEQPFVIRAHVNKTDSYKNKLVVQSKYFVQKIRTTKCTNKELSCFDEIKSEQDNIETYCDERHSTITLYVYENGFIHAQPFRIPVSCVCKVQFKDLKK